MNDHFSVSRIHEDLQSAQLALIEKSPLVFAWLLRSRMYRKAHLLATVADVTSSVQVRRVDRALCAIRSNLNGVNIACANEVDLIFLKFHELVGAQVFETVDLGLFRP